MEKQALLKRVRVVLVLNLFIVIVAAVAVFKAIAKGELWRIVTSSLGCAGFLAIVLILFLRMRKLQEA